MPISAQRSLHAAAGPSGNGLSVLHAHLRPIIETWRRRLAALGLTHEQRTLLEKLDLEAAVRCFGTRRFGAMRQQVSSLGVELARARVRFEHVAAALALLEELCVSRLIRHAPGDARTVVAAARLFTLLVRTLVPAFVRQWEVMHRETTASLKQASHRLHEAFDYTTGVYERERRRLSHDLHDDIGHDLIMLKLHLETLGVDLQAADPRKAARRLEDALGLTSRCIDSVRRLILDLGPAIFDELGFLPALRYYTKQFSANTGIRVTVVEGDIPPRIPMSHQVALYRLLQGALSNVVKHARAKNVTVRIGSMKASVLIMVVEDDGVGFDASSLTSRRSFGLTAMRERVQLLGGRFHIQSGRRAPAAGQTGTRIEIDLPLPVTATE